MAERGAEVIVGFLDDVQYGRIVMFGLGGVFVEVIKDVAFRAVPIDKQDAIEMIEQLNFKKILEGARGAKPVDKGALADLLVAVSEIARAYPEIAELDLNPVIARDNGFSIVDARMVMKSGN
jgi:acetyltransferase